MNTDFPAIFGCIYPIGNLTGPPKPGIVLLEPPAWEEGRVRDERGECKENGDRGFDRSPSLGVVLSDSLADKSLTSPLKS